MIPPLLMPPPEHGPVARAVCLVIVAIVGVLMLADFMSGSKK